MDDRQHTLKLRDMYKKKLAILELRKAKKSDSFQVDDELAIIEYTEEIKRLDKDLYNLFVNKIDKRIESKKILNIDEKYLYLANNIGYEYIINLYEKINEDENHQSYYFYKMIFDLIEYEYNEKIYSQEYYEIVNLIDLNFLIKNDFLIKSAEILMNIFENMHKNIDKFNKYTILEGLKEVNKKNVNSVFVDKLIEMFEKMNIMEIINGNLKFNIEILDSFDKLLWKTNYKIFNNLILDLFINKKKYIIEYNYINDIYCMVLKNNIEINDANYESIIYLNYYHIRRYKEFKKIDKMKHYNKYYLMIPLSFLMDFNDYSDIDLYFHRFNLDENISISRYLITNADFKCFIDDNGYHKLEFWSVKGQEFLKDHQRDYNGQALLEGDSIGLWNYPRYWFHYAYNNGLQPVVGISYYEAESYCNWLTYKGHEQGWLKSDEEIRLPTLAEWIDVARYTDDRPYPWGYVASNDEILAHTQHSDNLLDYPACINIFPRGIGIGDVFDLFGNVDEWTCTVFNEKNHLVVGGSFEESLGTIRERHDFLAAVVKYLRQNPHFSVLDADTKIVEEQGFSSSPSKMELASSRLRTLGFRIVRAKRTKT